MVLMTTEYQGEKHCESSHPSQAKIQTDAPKDNNGKGEAFSPTDLLGAATVSCMLTVLGINADKEGIELKGSHGSVTKEMASNPRRISKLTLNLHLPKVLNEETRTRFEHIALNCPVKLSLHPEMQIPVSFHYDV